MAQAAAEPLDLGNNIGVWAGRAGRHLDDQSRECRRWRTPRKPSSSDAANAAPERRTVLAYDAARQPRAALGRPGRGLRLAVTRTMASSSTTPAACGSAATARGDPHPEVHEGWKVPVADRQAERPPGSGAAPGQTDVPPRQQRPDELRPRGEDHSSIRRPTRPTSRTAISTSAWPCSTPTPATMQALLGRVRQQSRTTSNLGPLRSRRAAGAAVPQPGALRRSRRRTDCCMCATGVNDRIQVFRPDGNVREGRHSSRRTTLGRRVGVGHRVLEGSAAEIHLPRRRHQQAASTSFSATRSKC